MMESNATAKRFLWFELAIYWYQTWKQSLQLQEVFGVCLFERAWEISCQLVRAGIDREIARLMTKCCIKIPMHNSQFWTTTINKKILKNSPVKGLILARSHDTYWYIDNLSKMAPSKIWQFTLLHSATLGNHQNIFKNKLSLVLFRGMGMSSALFRGRRETQLIWKWKSPAFDSGKVGWYRYCFRTCQDIELGESCSQQDTVNLRKP